MKDDKISLGKQQTEGLFAVKKWYNDYKAKRTRKKWFFLGGYAGTGKTFTAKWIVEELGAVAVYGAYTGKAALVMRKSGCVGASTVHSLIYTPDVDPDTGVVTFNLSEDSPLRDVDLVVIDEVSMVNEEMALDLLSFNKPILVLGDPAQLPPVSGAGYFTNDRPDFMMTEIHRQAAENPIIALATQVRQGNIPSPGQYGDSRILSKGERPTKNDALDHDIILTGRNVTRDSMNQRLRKMRGFYDIDDELPVKGENIICTRNDRKTGLFNGGIYQVYAPPFARLGNSFEMVLKDSDPELERYYEVRTRTEFFDGSDHKNLDWRILSNTHHFDFAHAITVHKAQGSTYDSCLIYDESYCFRENWSRWLYTAFTRAASRITVVTT